MSETPTKGTIIAEGIIFIILGILDSIYCCMVLHSLHWASLLKHPLPKPKIYEATVIIH